MHRLVCCEFFASPFLIYNSILLSHFSFSSELLFSFMHILLFPLLGFVSLFAFPPLCLSSPGCLWCSCTPLLSVSGSLDSVWDRKWAGLGLRDIHVSDLFFMHVKIQQFFCKLKSLTFYASVACCWLPNNSNLSINSRNAIVW